MRSRPKARPAVPSLLAALLALWECLPALPRVGASTRRGRPGRRAWYHRLQRPWYRTSGRPDPAMALARFYRSRLAA